MPAKVQSPPRSPVTAGGKDGSRQKEHCPPGVSSLATQTSVATLDSSTART